MGSRLEVFRSRAAACDAAADALAAALANGGTLVVTGGSTPGPVYDSLSARDLDWSNISVTLSDERWVDPQASQSNARLVRERLLVGRASVARFTPFTYGGVTPAADAAHAEAAVAALVPFAAVLLGMGEDGHVASLFPGDPAALTSRRLVVPVPTAGLTPFVPRISLTFRALLATPLVVLVVAGEAKRAIVERILAGGADELPAARLLRQDQVPIRVLWAA